MYAGACRVAGMARGIQVAHILGNSRVRCAVDSAPTGARRTAQLLTVLVALVEGSLSKVVVEIGCTHSQCMLVVGM